MRNSNLDAYLFTEGKSIPQDAELFSGDGQYCDYCPLCYPSQLNHHHEHTLLEFIDGRQLYICEDCSFDVEIMEKSRVVKADTSGEAGNRIVDYLISGRLPRNVDRFINIEDTCVFCFSDIVAASYNDSMFLKVPVTKSTVGGYVCVCSDCAERCNWANKVHWQHLDSCYNCGEDYPISEDEATYRRDIRGDSTGLHLCSSCFGLHHGLFSFERYEYQPCICKEKSSILIDLTLQGKTWDHNPRECHACRPNSQPADMVKIKGKEFSYPSEDDDELLHNVTDTISIKYFRVGSNGWAYEIRRAREPGSTFHTSLFSTGNAAWPIEDAVTFAMRNAAQYLENTKKDQEL